MMTATGQSHERSGRDPRNRMLVAAVVVSQLAVGCDDVRIEHQVIKPVRVLKVEATRAFHGRDFPGRAKARHEVDLSFRVSGPLVLLPVDVGSQVKEGDVLAAIDSKDFRVALDGAQGNLDVARANLVAMERGARPEEVEQLKAALAEAEAAHRQAQAEHQRSEQLWSKQAVTKSEFDATLARKEVTAAQVTKANENLRIGLQGARKEDLEAKRAQIESLEAAVANARNQLDYTMLKAPFDGSIAVKYVDNFQTVQANQPVFRLLDTSMIDVTVQVPESLIGLAPLVKNIICRFDALPGREFVAHITKIGSEASQITRTYPVTVAVDQPKDVQILPGMAATVHAAPPEEVRSGGESFVVPPGAIFTSEDGQADQQSYVWVVDEGGRTVARRAIKTGALTPGGLEVLDGLRPGECIVTAGVHSVREGQRVRLLEDESRQP